MGADQDLDVVTLYLRHGGRWQTRATWDYITDPVWYARPWNGGQDRPWDGAAGVVTAATAGDLDDLLAKLDAEAGGAGPGSGAASRPSRLGGTGLIWLRRRAEPATPRRTEAGTWHGQAVIPTRLEGLQGRGGNRWGCELSRLAAGQGLPAR
jgi:hypothetical protein